MQKYKFHAVAAIFPDMPEPEYQALKDDIENNGLHEPIWLYENKIIDGRHRYRACTELGRKTDCRNWNGKGSAVDFVISMNLKRRHLTASQRAMAAADSLPFYEKEAKERERMGRAKLPDPNKAGRARDHAGKAFSVASRYVSDAKTLTLQYPKLATKIRSKELTLVEANRQVRRQSSLRDAGNLPAGKYRIIYADPPWDYGNAGLPEYGHAKTHYPSMTTTALCELPIEDMAGDNAVLFLWATSPLLEDAFRVIRAWGFKYKTSFVWDKVKHNFGYYNSVRHEFLLVCTRGSCTPDASRLFDSVQTIERTPKHSEKPERFRDIIETLYTKGRKIELFARGERHGWKSWGNEV